MSKISRVVQVVFKTEDGKEHKTEQAARLHNVEVDAFKALSAVIEETFNERREINRDLLVKLLLEEEEAVRAILLKLHQRKPKPPTSDESLKLPSPGEISVAA